MGENEVYSKRVDTEHVECVKLKLLLNMNEFEDNRD